MLTSPTDQPRDDQTERAASGAAPAPGVRLPYLPGLDGLRAIAVLAVLLYHADLPWMPGGFLGVEVFFVVSGYLITGLLLAEREQTGRVNLGAFWLRRARRLLPALFALLAATLAFAVLFLPDEVAGLRGDVLAALGYVTNWGLIFSQRSYFETVGRPPLLQHLWSLAVEEQFYLLWPLLFGAAIWRWRRRAVLIAVLAAAAASALLMAGLYDPDVDPSRVYYGTDTRAAGFLIGAALACAWSPSPGRSRRSGARPIDLAGLAAIGALAGCFLAVDEFQPLLYRGGFALVALVAALVIAAVAAPSARLVPAALGWRPLRWVGLRSYSIYLWHWPVFMVTRPQLDLPLDGLPLLGLRLLATLALAEISYRLVETPIRRGALGRAWRELRESHGARQRRIGAGWAAVAGGGIALVAVLGAAAAHARPPAPPAYLAEEPASPAAEIPTAPGASAAEAPTAPAATPAATRARSTKPERARAATAGPARSARMTKPAPAEPPEPPAVTSPEPAPPEPAVSSALSLGEPQPAPPEPAPAPPEPAARVTAIGDSVMRGAAEELGHAIGNVVVDAKVGRQVTAAIAILRARRDAGQLGDVVVVHLGNNGFFNAKKFDELMEVLSGVRRVVLVNVKVPRRWQSPNDGMLSEGVGRYPNAVLVDWYAASADRPELFWHDGIHLRPTGARLYADLIAAQVNAP